MSMFAKVMFSFAMMISSAACTLEVADPDPDPIGDDDGGGDDDEGGGGGGGGDDEGGGGGGGDDEGGSGGGGGGGGGGELCLGNGSDLIVTGPTTIDVDGTEFDITGTCAPLHDTNGDGDIDGVDYDCDCEVDCHQAPDGQPGGGEGGGEGGAGGWGCD